MQPNVMVHKLLETGKLFYKCPSNVDVDTYNRLTADQPVDNDLARSLSGVGSSLDDALTYAGEFGTIATMPLLVAALATADEEHPLWMRYSEYHPKRSFGSFTSRTERILYEDMGKIWGVKNSAVVLYVHGGTIISADRINSEFSRRHAEDKSLKSNPTAELFSHAELLWIRPQEVYDLLTEIEDGRLPLYEVEDVKKNKISDPFGRYAVAVPLGIAQRAKTSVDKRAFLENPLVLAAAGTPEYLEPLFDRLTKSKALDMPGLKMPRLDLPFVQVENQFGTNIRDYRWQSSFLTTHHFKPTEGYLGFESGKFSGLFGSSDLFVGPGCFVAMPQSNTKQKSATTYSSLTEVKREELDDIASRFSNLEF